VGPGRWRLGLRSIDTHNRPIILPSFTWTAADEARNLRVVQELTPPKGLTLNVDAATDRPAG
jgi:hypothetical protein